MNRVKGYLVLSLGVLMVSIAIAESIAGTGGRVNATELPLRDGLDLTTQTPYQASVTVTMAAGESGKNVAIDVPVGKLFVIEHVSASGSAPSDQRIDLSIATHISPDLTNRTHYLMTDRVTSAGVTYHKTSQPIKAYADTPSVTCRAARSSSPDSVTFRFTVSGYLVNKPL